MNLKPPVVILAPEPYKRKDSNRIRAYQDTQITAEEVQKALLKKGFKVKRWEVGHIPRLAEDLEDVADAVFFNLCEDVAGRSEGEAYVAALLELYGLAYTGSPPESLLCCLNKIRAKQILQAQGLPTPAGIAFEHPHFNGEKLRYPAIVKPACEDASIGISLESVVTNKKNLARRLRVLSQENLFPVLVEEYVIGREINAAILGESVLPLSEIDLSFEPNLLKQICDYDAKWEPSTVVYQKSVATCPAQLDAATEKKIKKLAWEAFQALGCRDYARVDFRLRSDGEPFILEVNPNPCLAPDAGFFRSARAAGFRYEDLIEKIVSLALTRKKEKAKA